MKQWSEASKYRGENMGMWYNLRIIWNNIVLNSLIMSRCIVMVEINDFIWMTFWKEEITTNGTVKQLNVPLMIPILVK
jgi:hypothetical protein